jgi:hypothetical protein
MSQFEARAEAKARPKQPNQYTARRKQVDAENNKDRWQDNPRFTAAALMRRLAEHQDGSVELSSTQIKAIELMLDRVAPRLSSIEQTVIDPRDSLSEQDIATQLTGIISANPDVILTVVGIACAQPGMAQRIIDKASELSTPVPPPVAQDIGSVSVSH